MNNRLSTFKVAAIQASSILFDSDAGVDKACELIRKAADLGARLAVFPECFLPGYPIWFDFYTATHKKTFLFYRKLFESSIEIPDRRIAQLCDVARETNIIVVMGICERLPKTTGTLYNSQVFIDNCGRVLGVRRKLVPTHKERIVHAPGFGTMLRVYETEIGRIGGLICGENSNPLAKFHYMSQGEVLHAASWPAYFFTMEMSENIGFVSKALAYENKVFVINSAAVIDEENLNAIDVNMDSLPDNFLASNGGSSIVAPSAEILAGPVMAEEQILCCEIDTDDIITRKMIHDFSGHYNRFDVFSLDVKSYIPPPADIEIPSPTDQARQEEMIEEKGTPESASKNSS